MVTIPLKAYRTVPVEPLRGKIVIDTGNYYPQRDGQIAELDDESTTTRRASSRRTCRSPSSSRRSTTSTSARSPSLARPSGDPERSVLAIAGDDAGAKARVGELLDSLGYDTYDAGPLSEGWRFQRDLPAYAQLYSADLPGTWPPQTHRRVDEAFLVEQLGKAEALPRHVISSGNPGEDRRTHRYDRWVRLPLRNPRSSRVRHQGRPRHRRCA